MYLRLRPERPIRLAAVLLLALAASDARAQDAAPPALDWKQGPAVVPVGSVAEIQLPEHFVALDQAETRRFLDLTENPQQGNEVAVVASAAEGDSWFLVFEYDEIGYVRDDEKDALDAEAMLESIREGTAASNEERKSRGWSTMEIVGWQEEPHYDTATNNLTWAIVGESDQHQTVNKLVKLLGRRGVMTATLVAGPEQFAAASATTNQLLGSYQFRAGEQYADFVEGSDSIAEIGLKGLVLGGVGAALIKSGVLGKFWKVIVAAVVGLGAGMSKLLGRKKSGGVGTPS